jgi:hypothetical protein
MLRSIALTAGLLAALPAMAGEMGADEARRFVIGKMFTYTCFEGTRGLHPIPGLGRRSLCALAAQHAASARRVRLRHLARNVVPTLLQS